MFCKKCGTEYSDDAKFCPNCASPNSDAAPAQAPVTPMQPPKKKKKRWIFALVAVVILIVVIALVNSGGDDNEPQKVNGSGNAAQSEQVDTSKVFGINEAVKYNGLELSVTKVARSSGKEFDKPKDGMEFIIVTVKYKNVGDEKISYNPFDFKMLNSKGQITDQTFTTVNTETALSSGELAPGGEISGTIAFEQPKGDTGLKLQYTGNWFSSDADIEFQLN